MNEIDRIIRLVLSGRINEIISYLKENPRGKLPNCLLTREEAVVLVLREILGFKTNEIADLLEINRSTVYAVLRRVKDKVKQVLNTARIIDSLTKPIIVDVARGTRVSETIDKIFKEADSKRVKLPYKSYELVEILKKYSIMENDMVSRDVRILVTPYIGVYVFEPHR